jgi:hypothetical protein
LRRNRSESLENAIYDSRLLHSFVDIGLTHESRQGGFLQIRPGYSRNYQERSLIEDRREVIASITEQETMTPELLDAVARAEDKTWLEDLYLPDKQKRPTKARIAIEAGTARSMRRPRPGLPPGPAALGDRDWRRHLQSRRCFEFG